MLEVTESLDFNRIRQALAERASTSIGREALLALQPKSTLEEAQRQQEIVAEALAYPYRLGGTSDLRPPWPPPARACAWKAPSYGRWRQARGRCSAQARSCWRSVCT